MEDSIVKVEHLSHRYLILWAIQDINFEIKEKGVLGLLGSNGAGKSTTMNILTGCLSSTSGRVIVQGIDVLADPLGAKRLIGDLPEQPPLYLDMTVDEYLGFNYDIKGSRLPREAHLAEVCEVVHIGDVRRHGSAAADGLFHLPVCVARQTFAHDVQIEHVTAEQTPHVNGRPQRGRTGRLFGGVVGKNIANGFLAW